MERPKRQIKRKILENFNYNSENDQPITKRVKKTQSQIQSVKPDLLGRMNELEQDLSSSLPSSVYKISSMVLYKTLVDFNFDMKIMKDRFKCSEKPVPSGDSNLHEAVLEERLYNMGFVCIPDSHIKTIASYIKQNYKLPNGKFNIPKSIPLSLLRGLKGTRYIIPQPFGTHAPPDFLLLNKTSNNNIIPIMCFYIFVFWKFF